MGGPAIASVASLGSIGLSAYAEVEKGKGQKAADEYQADRADQAAKFGRLQADLTDVTMRERLNTTIGNIDAIRAAGNVDPTSPTTSAIDDWNRMLSDRQRTAAVVTARSQADADEAGARYLRQAGSYAQQMSYLSAGTKVAGGIAKYATGGGGGYLGNAGGTGGNLGGLY